MSSDKTARQGAYLLAKSHPLAECPLHAAFVAVGGKWKLTILYWLARETHHFSALLRRVTPISHKVLTEQLRELEADGLVERLATAPVPAPVQYRLSDYGRTVLPLVENARIWGQSHLQRVRGADMRRSAATSLSCSEALVTGTSAGSVGTST
ncbi:helix-turn-helix transcriptional regulator [Rhodanobacter sp. FDAARGOS 1247]|uniref:winged helix-turn-helix transcriptional regulator n=1 Tax=Rhodanobacter sp. FDAARGOS 1247 TaxID=2778082 RepID=UPI00194FC03C|nr:helix-turn-helix domain-containing protein [Rhodanobacter sp. FDAARGOS 1247]QRP62463.1 helix-turn-helix transcriptional regulator [Rhodanobacter sp. FDAARGOS 1247]